KVIYLTILACRIQAAIVRWHAAKLFVIDQLRNGRVLTANGAVRVLAQLYFVELHRQGIIQQQPSIEGLANAQNQLDRFRRLQRSNRARQNAQRAALRAAWHQARRGRLGEEAAVARSFLGVEDRYLALEAEDAAIDVGFAQNHTGVVGQITGGEIICAVNDHIIRLQNLQRVI